MSDEMKKHRIGHLITDCASMLTGALSGHLLYHHEWITAGLIFAVMILFTLGYGIQKYSGE